MKISRRLMLGTVIGTLVVTPFVVRSFRKKPTTLPDRDEWYFKAWRDTLDKIRVPIHDIRDDSFSFKSDFDVSNFPQTPITALWTQLNGTEAKLGDSDVPAFFRTTDGLIESVDRKNDATILHVSALSTVYSTARKQESKGKETLILSENDGIPLKSSPCDDVISGLNFIFPSNETVFKGKNGRPKCRHSVMTPFNVKRPVWRKFVVVKR